MTIRWLVDVDAAIRPLVREIAKQEERTPGDVVRRLIREAMRARGIEPPTPIAIRRSEAGQNVAA
jgi:hypothetical protein